MKEVESLPCLQLTTNQLIIKLPFLFVGIESKLINNEILIKKNTAFWCIKKHFLLLTS